VQITIDDSELTSAELVTAVAALRKSLKLPAAASPAEAVEHAKEIFGFRLRTQVQTYRTMVAIRDQLAIINDPETSAEDRATARAQKDAIVKNIADQFKAMTPPTVTFA